MKIEFTQLQRYEGLWGAWHELTVALATWSRSIQEQSTFLKKVQLEHGVPKDKQTKEEHEMEKRCAGACLGLL